MKDPNRPFKKWLINRSMGFGPIHNYSELVQALEEAWDGSAKYSKQEKRNNDMSFEEVCEIKDKLEDEHNAARAAINKRITEERKDE